MLQYAVELFHERVKSDLSCKRLRKQLWSISTTVLWIKRRFLTLYSPDDSKNHQGCKRLSKKLFFGQTLADSKSPDHVLKVLQRKFFSKIRLTITVYKVFLEVKEASMSNLSRMVNSIVLVASKNDSFDKSRRFRLTWSYSQRFSDQKFNFWKSNYFWARYEFITLLLRWPIKTSFC